MLGTRVTAWRNRRLRARVADVALVGVIALVAAAVFANAPTTVRDTKRSRLDQKVLRHYLKAHPELGSFGPPSTFGNEAPMRSPSGTAPRRPSLPSAPADIRPRNELGRTTWLRATTSPG